MKQQLLSGAVVSTGRTRALPWFLIAIICTWGVTVSSGFVWIDHAEIQDGAARVQTFEDANLVWQVSLDDYLERREGGASAAGGYFRPLYCLSLTLSWLIGRGAPAWFHIENMLWHLAVVWLLYRIGCRVLEAERFGERIAFWSAMLFAAHPMCSQSVAWCSGRKDLLCATFALFALNCFGDCLRTPIAGEHIRVHGAFRRFVPLILAPLMLLCAILSKELAYVVPLFATVWFCFRPGELKLDANTAPGAAVEPHLVLTAPTQRRGFVCLLMLWCVVASAGFYRISTIGSFGLGGSYPAASVAENAHISAALLGRYVFNSYLPIDPTLSLIHI